MDRKEWLEKRKGGIGGSEMAAILGLSPWEGPADVWARKKGITPEREDNLRFKIGRYFEAPIAQIYAEQEGVKLLKPEGLYVHPDAPLVGTPDRLIAGQTRGLEIKTADPAVAHLWGEPGTDEIPLYYTTQVAVYMSLLDYSDWDVAVLFGTSDFRVYRLRRDLELENMILEKAREFWIRYVAGNEEPPPDESKAYGAYLTKKYPSNILPLLEANDEQTAAVAKYIEIADALKDVERQAEFMKNVLKSEIGENDGLTCPFGRVTWKKTKDIDVVDWESVARELVPMVPPPLIEKHTAVKPGVRRFNVFPSKLPVKGATA